MTSPCRLITAINLIVVTIMRAVDAVPEPGMDLLESLQMHNLSRQGVSLAPGPQRLRPAFYLQGDYRDLKLPDSVYLKAVDLLRHNSEFTVAASLKQEQANSGSILAFSHGFNRYLELQSSGRKSEVRLHYTSQTDGTVHVETFPYRLADDTWHKVAVSISGTQVQLLVDCHPIYLRLLPRPPDTNFTLPELSLWVGQRNKIHSLFKGALQDVRLIAGPHGYLNQCPHLDTACPTCGQFSILQNTVKELNLRLQQLSEKLQAFEGRMSLIEECDCQKSCTFNGSVLADGASWQHDCDICSCVHGTVQCRPVQCSPLSCKTPVKIPGECCPSCLKQCYMRGTLYDHGDSVSLKQCVECECRDGSMQCTRIDPETMCSPLNCPPSQQFSVPDECCKFCPGVDYCSRGHNCHINASCLNLETTFACHCNSGYQGDGYKCSDVDECLTEGGLEGHHCHKNTRCVNTAGSYVCECLPGFTRQDRFSCVELDECATGVHQCNYNAFCNNTLGSYTCTCREGFTGDGFHCSPVCNETCLNGGECKSPGKCHCRRGYHGHSCELDLDECAANLHGCQHGSMCVNMPGWYYCQCKPGYRTNISFETNVGSSCIDVDECEAGTHTCHSSAQCVNTDGAFRCTCPPVLPSNPHNSICKLSCMVNGVEIQNGESFSSPGTECSQCVCREGYVSCNSIPCDCSLPESRTNKCCPKCDPSASCRHQELRHVTFTSGEKWVYQCQTCECLFGEVDCWPIECPPVSCSNPVLSPQDCCPRCMDDPCFEDNLASTNSNLPCPFANHLRDSNNYWNRPNDKCTSCNCKVPYCAQLDGSLCCVFDSTCDSNSQQPISNSSAEPLPTQPPNTTDLLDINNNSSTLSRSDSQVQEATKHCEPSTAPENSGITPVPTAKSPPSDAPPYDV